jgi:hypothetical protein
MAQVYKLLAPRDTATFHNDHRVPAAAHSCQLALRRAVNHNKASFRPKPGVPPQAQMVGCSGRGFLSTVS